MDPTDSILGSTSPRSVATTTPGEAVEPSLAPVSIVLSPEEEKVRVAGGRLLLTVKGFDRGFSPLYRQSWAPTSGRSIPQRLPPTSARRELAGSHGLSPCRRLFRTDISMPRFAHSSAPASGHNQRSAPRPDSICAVPLLLCLPHLQIVRQDSKSHEPTGSRTLTKRSA